MSGKRLVFVAVTMVGRYKWVEPDHMQFSQDGSILKVSKEAGDRYFDAQDGTLLEPETIPENQAFAEPARSRCLLEEYEGSEIFHQASSVDGAFAAGSGTYNGFIYVFDNDTCKVLNEFYIGGGEHFLSWLPARPGECGGALLTASLEGALDIWDPWSGQQLRAGGFAMGPQLAWSPDGATLAVGADTLVVLVDVDTMAVADVLGGDRKFQPILGQGYYGGVSTINWDSNDRLVIAGHNEITDATVMVWTPQNGAEWYEVPDIGYDFVLSPDGQLLASRGYKTDINVYTIRLWEVHSGALLWTVEVPRTVESPQSCHRLVWSPDGTRLVCTSDDQTVVFDVDTGQPVDVLPQSLTNPRVAWSPDGVYLALNPTWEGGYTVVWDIEHDEHFTLEGLSDPSWSPDGQWIAGAGVENTVVIWGLQQRALTHTLVCHSDYDYVVAWSPDGTLLASRSWDNTVIIFDVAEERLVKRLEGHTPSTRGVVSVAWSPDGRWLASVAGDLTLIIWDVSQNGQ